MNEAVKDRLITAQTIFYLLWLGLILFFLIRGQLKALVLTCIIPLYSLFGLQWQFQGFIMAKGALVVFFLIGAITAFCVGKACNDKDIIITAVWLSSIVAAFSALNLIALNYLLHLEEILKSAAFGTISNLSLVNTYSMPYMDMVFIGGIILFNLPFLYYFRKLPFNITYLYYLIPIGLYFTLIPLCSWLTDIILENNKEALISMLRLQ